MRINKTKLCRTTLFVGVAATALSAMTASAASFSNPGAAVSSGAIPFKLTCEFTDYDNDGGHSATTKKATLPMHQTFSFAGKNVQNANGHLRGYVSHSSDSRHDWRMETGETGSPIYCFTQLRGTDEIIANIHLIGPTGGGGNATAAGNPGVDTATVTVASNPGADSVSVSVDSNPATGYFKSPMSNIKGVCS